MAESSIYFVVEKMKMKRGAAVWDPFLASPNRDRAVAVFEALEGRRRMVKVTRETELDARPDEFVPASE